MVPTCFLENKLLFLKRQISLSSKKLGYFLQISLAIVLKYLRGICIRAYSFDFVSH